jgi:outer membrane protein OmpA-like peptidoglycan-associated protein
MTGTGQDDRIVRDADGGYWQRRPGRPGAALAIGVAGLAVAAVVQYGGFATLGSVQDDLTARASAALTQNGWTGLTVTASGRDLTVSGLVDPAAVPKILDLVRAQTGVRVATFEDTSGSGVAFPPATATTAGSPTASATPSETASTTPTGSPTTSPTPSATPSTSSAAPTASTPPAPTPSPTASNPIVNSAGGSADAAAAAAALAKLPKIQFPTSLSGPTDSGRATITKIAAILKAYPSVKVQIQGHTDDRGTARVNLELSASRAEVTRTLLIAAGIKGSRLTAKGYGETRPFVPNTSDANRATNRRVSFLLS